MSDVLIIFALCAGFAWGAFNGWVWTWALAKPPFRHIKSIRHDHTTISGVTFYWVKFKDSERELLWVNTLTPEHTTKWSWED